MKTRQEALDAVDLKYGVNVTQAQNTLNDAQDTYSQLLAGLNQKRDEVNAYYDALEQQTSIDAILNNPPDEAQ